MSDEKNFAESGDEREAVEAEAVEIEEPDVEGHHWEDPEHADDAGLIEADEPDVEGHFMDTDGLVEEGERNLVEAEGHVEVE